MSARCEILPSKSPELANTDDIDDCVKDGLLLLANGKAMRYESACFVNYDESRMPVKIGKVGPHLVQTLRDTGCS